MRRVVITGLGLVTPIGIGAENLWAGVLAGRSAVGPLTRFDPSPFRSRLAAEIPSFDPLDYVDAHAVRRMDRFAQFGVAAARLAMQDAVLDRCSIAPHRAGVAVGSALGGIAYAEQQHEDFVLGRGAISPTLAIAVYGGSSGAAIGMYFDFRGPNLSNASSCASGAVAIGEGLRTIQRGDADVILAGGVETPLAPLTFGAFSTIKAMSTRNHDPEGASRPFDRERDGFVMAEGAGILVLEDRERARARGAPIYAEVLGFGQTSDAYHMTAPRPGGMEAARAIALALQGARVCGDQIDYINAHATGTRLGDAAESQAIRAALGEHGAMVPVSGTKGLYGHALGASGAIEVGITALALHHGYLPGSTNLTGPDDDCGLNLIPVRGLTRSAGVALSTSFGFGGVNAAIVLAHPEFRGDE